MKRAVGIATFLLLPAIALAEPCQPEDARDACQELDVATMPGGIGTLFMMNGQAKTPFVGGGVHLAPRVWSKSNERLAPSQGSLFVQAAILRSSNERDSLALFDLGGTFAFERNPARRYLLPYFGGALGYLVRDRSGSSVYLLPLVGVDLLLHPNFVLAADAGYLFPFTRLDTLRGVRADLTLRFSLY